MKELPAGLSAAARRDAHLQAQLAAAASSQRPNWLLAGLALACAVVAVVMAVLISLDARATPAEPLPTPAVTSWSANPFASGGPSEATQEADEQDRVAALASQRVDQLWQSGSLRGSEVDGDWGRWVDNTLQPSLSLRRRFDYLLTANGEVEPSDLRHWIEQQVTDTMDASAARQVLAVWDRYIELQQYKFSQPINPKDERTWQAALAERTRVRSQLLGDDWARAFYTGEEQAFSDFMAERLAGKGGADAATAPSAEASLLIAAPSLSESDQAQLQARRTRQFGAPAAERLRVQDAAWADWERRVAEARRQMQAIAQSPELSALQRDQAQAAWLQQRFSGNELVRAQALLRAGS